MTSNHDSEFFLWHNEVSEIKSLISYFQNIISAFKSKFSFYKCEKQWEFFLILVFHPRFSYFLTMYYVFSILCDNASIIITKHDHVMKHKMPQFNIKWY